MRLGEFLKERREEKGLSQRGLAIKMGVSNSTISQIESSRNNPSAELLLLYSKEFNIDIVELYEWMNEEIEEENKIKGRFSKPNGLDNLDIESVKRADMSMLVPLVGVVRAGETIFADQNIEGYVALDRNSLSPDKSYYALKVKGDSMDRLFPDGTTIIVEKTEMVENGQIAIVGINGYEATVKRVSFGGNNIALTPNSNNPAFKPEIYDLTEEDIHIMGRVVQAITYF